MVAAMGSALEFEEELRLEGEAAAVGDLEALRGLEERVVHGREAIAAGACEVGANRHRVAIRRVEGEFVAIDTDSDVTDPDRNPLIDLGQRIGRDGGLAGIRIDTQSRADRYHAEVVRTHQGWRNDDHAERSAMV